LEHEFDRRVEEFNFQTNANENDEERINIIPVSSIHSHSQQSLNHLFHSKVSTVLSTPSPSATDEMNEFDEK